MIYLNGWKEKTYNLGYSTQKCYLSKLKEIKNFLDKQKLSLPVVKQPYKKYQKVFFKWKTKDYKKQEFIEEKKKNPTSKDKSYSKEGGSTTFNKLVGRFFF